LRFGNKVFVSIAGDPTDVEIPEVEGELEIESEAIENATSSEAAGG